MFIVGPQYLVDLVVVDVAELFVQPLCCRGGCGFGVLGVELCRFPVVWHGQSLTDPVAPRQRTRIRCPRRLWRQALTSPGVDTSAYSHQEAITINCPPEEIYDLIADVSRMGEWSPVCTGGSYDDDGEWFTGTNAMGGSTWETRCRVVAAERGREFAFINHGLEGRREMVRWGFTFRPAIGGGTESPRPGRCFPTTPMGSV